MLELNTYKTNLGLFFQVKKSENYYCTPSIDNHVINGVNVKDILKYNDWFRLPEAESIISVQKVIPETLERVGFELKPLHTSLASDEIPLNLSLQAVEEYWDDNEEITTWRSYSDYRSLYKEKYITKPRSLKDEEFKVFELGVLDISSFDRPEEMKVKYKYDNDLWNGNTVQQVDISSIVQYSDIERMLTPEFMLWTRPCELTSKQVYSIVRAFILENYNSKTCTIDSNYDFCFSVKKTVMCKPYEATIYTGAKLKPKLVQRNSTSVKIFEMTWAGDKSGNKGYEGYTCIDPWKANSLKELQEYIKQYLSDLIEILNSETEECTHCKGTGIKYTEVKTNDRNL